MDFHGFLRTQERGTVLENVITLEKSVKISVNPGLSIF
jgi:hypothetical protein